MIKYTLFVVGALGLVVSPAVAQNKSVKIGFVSTFSGPTAAMGNDMRNSLEVALDHLGRKMGGIPVEVIYEDDQQKPEIGKQKTDKLIESDRVDFIVGYIWSNVLLASIRPAVDFKTFLITSNAGPHQIAGEQCSPYIFSTSWQNDQTPACSGRAHELKGIKTAVRPLVPQLCRGQGHVGGRDVDVQRQDHRPGIHQVARSTRLLCRAYEGERREARRDLCVLSWGGWCPVPASVPSRPDLRVKFRCTLRSQLTS